MATINAGAHSATDELDRTKIAEDRLQKLATDTEIVAFVDVLLCSKNSKNLIFMIRKFKKLETLYTIQNI